jgi:hypothetical protein
MNRKLRHHHILSAVMVTTLAAATGCASSTRHGGAPAKAEPAQPITQSTPMPTEAPAPANADANARWPRRPPPSAARPVQCPSPFRP